MYKKRRSCIYPHRAAIGLIWETACPPRPPAPKTTPNTNFIVRHFFILPCPSCPPCPPCPTPPCPNPAQPPENRSRAPSRHAPNPTPAAALWTQGVPIPVHTPAPSRSLLFPHTRRALFVFPFAIRFSFWLYTIFEIVFNSRFSFSFCAFISIINFFLFFSQHFRIFRRTKCPCRIISGLYQLAHTRVFPYTAKITSFSPLAFPFNFILVYMCRLQAAICSLTFDFRRSRRARPFAGIAG